MSSDKEDEAMPSMQLMNANPGLDESEGTVSLELLRKMLERVQQYSAGREVTLSKIAFYNHASFGTVVRIKSASPFGEDDVGESITCYINGEGVLSVEMAFETITR